MQRRESICAQHQHLTGINYCKLTKNKYFLQLSPSRLFYRICFFQCCNFSENNHDLRPSKYAQKNLKSQNIGKSWWTIDQNYTIMWIIIYIYYIYYLYILFMWKVPKILFKSLDLLAEPAKMHFPKVYFDIFHTLLVNYRMDKYIKI